MHKPVDQNNFNEIQPPYDLQTFESNSVDYMHNFHILLHILAGEFIHPALSD